MDCDLILPCRNEGPALASLLGSVPAGLRVIVVDNGSTDDTAEVGRSFGALVVSEPRPGYGAAVHAGVVAASAEYVAIADGDGSFDLNDLLPMLEVVRRGEAEMAVGRRRPTSTGTWPWHARAGNALIVAWLRRRIGMSVNDIAPMRVCRREDLLALGVQDRRFGYPVELLQRATRAGWRLSEHDVSYGPRAAGTRSKVSGSVVGTIKTAHDFWRVLALSLDDVPANVLVMAKAPVAGRVKTRLGRDIGMDSAAELAAAALLDTIDACSAYAPDRCFLALDGELADAVRGLELAERLATWTVFAQAGVSFADRLANAHAVVPGPVVQVGMDTPQVTARDLQGVVAGLTAKDAVLAPAEDGGWWALALRVPAYADRLRGVRMSTPETYRDTVAALGSAGLRVGTSGALRDVDTVADAAAVASLTNGAFSRAWSRHQNGPQG